MKDFTYTRDNTPDEWYFALSGKTRVQRRESLAAAHVAYQRRFNATLPAPKRLMHCGKSIVIVYPRFKSVAMVEGKGTSEPIQLTLIGG